MHPAWLRRPEATRGLVLTYEGAVAQALYHASSPGQTEDAGVVFGQAVPYLISSTSPEDPECKCYPFTRGELCALFGMEGQGEAIELTHTPAGRVAQVRLFSETFSGADVRKTLGLPSTCFTVSREGDVYTFACRGYGHGLGMSQEGANLFAQQGATWAEILAHYYPGTQVEDFIARTPSF